MKLLSKMYSLSFHVAAARFTWRACLVALSFLTSTACPRMKKTSVKVGRERLAYETKHYRSI
jgi:hypothetical protein